MDYLYNAQLYKNLRELLSNSLYNNYSTLKSASAKI